MTIMINRVKAAVTLENEKVLDEVMTNLESWLSVQGYSLTSALIDGKAFQALDPQLSLTEIQLIDIEAVPLGEEEIVKIHVVAEFFRLLEQSARTGNEALAADLSKEYPSIRSALFPVLEPVRHRIQGALHTLDNPWNDLGTLADPSKILRQEVESFGEELVKPESSFQASLHRLKVILDDLKSLGTLLQKGHDRQAMNLLLVLLAILEDLNRQGNRLSADQNSAFGPGFNWAERAKDLNVFLLEVKNAMEARDFVLLADLIEYEISPRLEALCSTIVT